MMTRYALYENAASIRMVRPHGAFVLSGYLRSGWEIVRLWSRRAQQRRQLLTLDERMLSDIGLTSAAQVCEGMKPFWKR